MYLDSAIIVKLLVAEPDSTFFQNALVGEFLWTSELSITEVASALVSKERQNLITDSMRRAALNLFDARVASGQMLILPIDNKIFTRARFLLETCHPDVALRSLDAIHLAACNQATAFPLCATDSRMRAAATKLLIPIFPESLPS
jgi:predicted nucleic acid-binding protein